MTEIARHRTAIGRKELSRPVRLAVESRLIDPTRTVLDYGCGRGSDVAHLADAGIQAVGWDPVHRPGTRPQPADIVNLGYVVNVIEDPAERADTLRRAFALSRQLLVVAARLELDKDTVSEAAFGDGYLTVRNTFQKYFSQLELRQWIDATLGVTSVAACPGVFFVFRDEGMREAFLAARHRRVRAAPKVRKSDADYEAHRALLQPLIDFIVDRGRVPEADEVTTAAGLLAVFGSIRRASALIRRVTGPEQWITVEQERRTELLIRLALERFGKRPKFAQLPVSLQRDIKALCSSYTKAIDEADRLLFSAGRSAEIESEVRSAKVGKLTGNALYVHADAIKDLPPVLQVYEGCARAFVGIVEAANIVKLHRDHPQVSYLLYPDFDSAPHPTLQASLVVHLQRCELSYREYDPAGNPPILHRKEELVAPDHPRRAEWSALTAAEERCGLYENTAVIGTRDGWRQALHAHGVIIRDGTVVPVGHDTPAHGPEAASGSSAAS